MLLSHWETKKELEKWYKESRPTWIGKVKDNNYLEPFEILKFGNIGCIARTNDPKVVVKITDKEEEAQILEYLHENDCDGFAKIYGIIQVWHKETKVWLVWREYFDLVGEEAFFEVAKNNNLEKNKFKSRLLKMLKTYEDNVLEDSTPFIQQMKKYTGFSKAAESIFELTNRGLIISDLRLGNIGANVGSKDLFIFDSMIETSSYLPEDYDEGFDNECYDPIDIWT